MDTCGLCCKFKSISTSVVCAEAADTPVSKVEKWLACGEICRASLSKEEKMSSKSTGYKKSAADVDDTYSDLEEFQDVNFDLEEDIEAKVVINFQEEASQGLESCGSQSHSAITSESPHRDFDSDWNSDYDTQSSYSKPVHRCESSSDGVKHRGSEEIYSKLRGSSSQESVGTCRKKKCAEQETVYVNEMFIGKTVSETALTHEKNISEEPKLEGLFIPADSEVLYWSRHSTSNSNSEDGLSDYYIQLFSKIDNKDCGLYPIESVNDEDEIFYKIRDYNAGEREGNNDLSSEVTLRTSEDLNRRILNLTYAKYMNTYFRHGADDSVKSDTVQEISYNRGQTSDTAMGKGRRRSVNLKGSKTIKESLEMLSLDKSEDKDVEDSKNRGQKIARKAYRCFLCLSAESDEPTVSPCQCRGPLGSAHRSCLAARGPGRCAVCLAHYKYTGSPTALQPVLLASLFFVLLLRCTVTALRAVYHQEIYQVLNHARFPVLLLAVFYNCYHGIGRLFRRDVPG